MADLNDKDRCGVLHTSEFGAFNTLGFTVGTNGYHGGDSGHGGRTYISIQDLGCTDMDASVSRSSEYGPKVEIILGGDSELDSIIEGLRWAADKLEELKNVQ